MKINDDSLIPDKVFKTENGVNWYYDELLGVMHNLMDGREIQLNKFERDYFEKEIDKKIQEREMEEFSSDSDRS